MIPPEINEIVKKAADIVLMLAFEEDKQFPITDWSYQVTPENIESLKHIENREISKYAIKNLDKIEEQIIEAIDRKLHYLYTEGFTYKRKGYYVLYTETEIEQAVQSILNND
jgi:hypothetical protein